MSYFVQFKTVFFMFPDRIIKSDFTLLALIFIKRFRMFYSLPKDAF